MSLDPYKVLGVSSTASNDDVKKAYRELSRKYHPDSYINNPLADLAEEKFKEVQDAYNQIMKEREQGGSSFGGGSNYGGGYNQSDSGDQSFVQLNAAYNYLSARQYPQALNVLAGISNRNARWYYYSAVANAGIGNNIQAMNFAQTAASMEPGNPEYSRFLNQLQYGNVAYRNNSYGQGRNNNDLSDMCCKLWMADTLCECMGGDLCGCF